MLYDKKAIVYVKGRNTKNVTSWTEECTIKCNIQPFGSSNGFDSMPAYNQYKMYTETMTIKEGDKIVCGDDTYIVKDAENWDGLLRKVLKVIMEKSRGT